MPDSWRTVILTYRVVAVVFTPAINHAVVLASALPVEPNAAALTSYANTFKTTILAALTNPYVSAPGISAAPGESDIFIKKAEISSFYVFQAPE